MLRSLGLVWVTLLALVGCDETVAPRDDAGGSEERDASPADAGAGPDSGAADAGLSLDAGAAVDSGSTPDGGPVLRPIGPRPTEPTPLAMGTLFAAPDGSGTACSEAAPCDIWEVTGQASAGDVVFLRGGVYALDRNLTFRGRGAAPPASFESYPGETAILEGSGSASDEYYIRVLGDPMVLRRFEVRRMPRMGIAVRSSDHLLEGLRVYENLLSGIHVHESYDTPVSNRNLITDCVVYDNSGAGLPGAEFADGGNSDGISMSSGTGNRVENCLVYGNSDDGIDTWRTTDSYVGYSIVHGSGIASGNGQGVKAGGAPPSARSLVEHCLSYDNRGSGFDFNSGVGVELRYNTSWGNANGFYSGADTTVENNVSSDPTAFGGAATPVNNSWQRSGEVAFVSTDPASSDFLRPTPGGGFEDIGAYAGRD